MIVQALYERQKLRGGHLATEDLRSVADELSVPLHRVQELVSFFPHFQTHPRPQVEVHVCRDMSCHLRGSAKIFDDLSNWADQENLEDVEICGASCLGRCDRAPAALINEKLYVQRDASELKQIISEHQSESTDNADSDVSRAHMHAENWKINPYEDESDYQLVRDYLSSSDPQVVLDTLEKAGLLGMGGAGGRTYLKWADVLNAQGSEKYVVCNADESEPGTFKDRDILIATPHLVVEGMILAGLVVGAGRGWIYIRHEYPEQIEFVQRELDRARRIGGLGRGIFGSSRSFELDIFVSPGGYICGEQTALIEAMEDRRAEPRNRPPELMTNGYKNQPTLLNNVETFAWVPAIMKRSAGTWFASEGIKEGPWVGNCGDRMRGRRMFSISGDVRKPGVYEVPTGISLGELIDDFCEGMQDDRSLVGCALSGPSGGILPPKIPVRFLSRGFVEKFVPEGMTEFDVRQLPLDINVSRAIGIMIGAGIVIYGSGTDLLAEAVANSSFFRNESCGKCVPCRIGSQKITQIGERLLNGSTRREELPTIQSQALELSHAMMATSICGLGQVASNPIRSLLTFFPDLINDACSSSNSSTPTEADKDQH